jgi:hypothetical protein
MQMVGSGPIHRELVVAMGLSRKWRDGERQKRDEESAGEVDTNGESEPYGTPGRCT